MQATSKPRKGNLSVLLDKHFLACAAAAAGGVAVTMDTADAAIVYSGLRNVLVDTTTAQGFYVNMFTGVAGNVPGATVPGYDMNIVGFTFGGLPGIFAGMDTLAAGLVGRTAAGYQYADRLAGGTLISAASTFMNGGATVIYGNPGGELSPPTSWHANESGFMGVRFQEGGQTYFGWLQFSVAGLNGNTPPRHIATVVDWAYENVPNTGIAAGAGIPEPTAAALGFLALGALGSRVWRKPVAA